MPDTVVIDEQEPFTFTRVLMDATGTPIPADQLGSLTLTLYNVDDGSILNGRDHEDVFNTHQGSFDPTSGLFTWQAQSADNALVEETTPVGHYERHCALFEWTTLAGGPTNVSRHEVAILVRQLAKVP